MLLEFHDALFFYFDCADRADVETCLALCAGVLIDIIMLSGFLDSTVSAGLFAHAATETLSGIDNKHTHASAHVGPAVFPINMLLILIPEVFDRTEDRVW